MKDQLKSIIQSLRPVKTKYDLIRVGGANDGGYLIPNDLEGITACFSPGVDVTASFEQDLLNRGIRSHLADGSVDGVPEGLEVSSFTKKHLRGLYTDQTMTLISWMADHHAFMDSYILQMDIEGAEYETILAADRNTLNRFRIIVIEVHNAQHWFHPIAFGLVQTFFAKLLEDFHVVHIHPNNNCPFIQYDEVFFPSVFELTLLRKDRAEPDGFVDTFPHALDQPNVTDKPDRSIPEEWYK
jgi:hypothetical protein